MKLYIINGEGYTWDYIHNSLGYTEYPSDTMLYMSAESATWGEYVTSGYSQYEGVYGDLGSCTFFATGKAGWFDLDELAKDAGLFPSVVNEGPEFTNGGATSPSVMYDFNGDLFYLLRDAVVLGWKTESDLAAQGWTIEVDADYELLFYDTSAGKVSYGVESLNELVFTATGYFTIEDGSDVVFVQPSQYPVVSPLSYNFDPNVTVADGSGIDTELPYYSQKLYIPVVVWHDENWNIGVDYIGWDIDGTSGSVVVTNSTGGTRIVLSVIAVLIDATDAEVVEVKNQSDEHFRAFKWTNGGTPYWYVEDGNEAWTDDLSAEGYEEVSPVPVVGDIITFGSYPQSTSTPEPIEWIVLDVDTENQMALLISKYLLASRQFSNSYSPRWWNCTLRTWLNDSFLNSAFNADELSQIALTSVNTEGVILSNYIFLLSVDEASGYFANDTARLGVATQAAINEGIYHTNEWYCPWWLRSTATSSPHDFATFVESDGTIHADGYYMTDTHFGVRPVLWMQYQ